jgi:hypothetical protein
LISAYCGIKSVMQAGMLHVIDGCTPGSTSYVMM